MVPLSSFSFLIGNKSNINHDEKKYMMFMIVNTRKNNKQHRRKITRGEILREERNSMIEEQFEEP